MPKKTSVADQLDKIEREKKALERRAQELKDAAALKLGKAVVDAGGLELDPAALKAFIKSVIDHGGLATATARLNQNPLPTDQAA